MMYEISIAEDDQIQRETLPAGGVRLENLEPELLGMSYKTFQYRLKKHDIQKKVEFD